MRRPVGSDSNSPVHRRSRSRPAAAVVLGALLVPGPPASGLTGSSPDASAPEPLSAALAAGRVRAEEVRGHAVYSFDEMPIGTLVAAADPAVVALDPRLGFGRGCVALPLGRLRLAAERRLLLDMTPREFQAALAARVACGA